MLHRVVRAHLETFLAEAKQSEDGTGLPRFVERELREFLTCGSLARGFARLGCETCKLEHLVAFSCKGRGFCPSCCGRRMAEGAADLVDRVLPHVPIRQWVLTLPHRLRYLLAWDHDLCRAVLAVHVRALLGFYRRRAARGGIRGGRSGAVTVIQRFGSAVNLNVHFHTLVLDGVFEDAAGRLLFHALLPPSDEEVARLLAAIRRRVLRLLERRGLVAGDHPVPPDPLAEESPALAGITGASVLGRIALGARAGGRVLRVGSDSDAPWVMVGGPRRAHLEGFDLHADLRVGANDRGRLEHLCRYLLRPPLPEGRLRLRPDGAVVLELKRAWSDGPTHLVFASLELLERLAALVPRPRINPVIYHGLLAAHARLRATRLNLLERARVPRPPKPQRLSPPRPRARSNDPGVAPAPAKRGARRASPSCPSPRARVTGRGRP